MGLHIESDEVERLAQELAALTGEPLAEAVARAICERLQQVRRDSDLAERIIAIGQECATRLKEPLRADEIDSLLYDERGLPIGCC